MCVARVRTCRPFARYALVGAGAMLGGFTRMTITIVVLLVESSGDVSLVLPLSLCVYLGNVAASHLIHPYDEALMHLKRIAFLDDEVARDIKT